MQEYNVAANAAFGTSAGATRPLAHIPQITPHTIASPILKNGVPLDTVTAMHSMKYMNTDKQKR